MPMMAYQLELEVLFVYGSWFSSCSGGFFLMLLSVRTCTSRERRGTRLSWSTSHTTRFNDVPCADLENANEQGVDVILLSGGFAETTFDLIETGIAPEDIVACFPSSFKYGNSWFPISVRGIDQLDKSCSAAAVGINSFYTTGLGIFTAIKRSHGSKNDTDVFVMQQRFKIKYCLVVFQSWKTTGVSHPHGIH